MKLGVTKASASSSYNGLGDQLYDLGGARPTLDLNFSSNESLVDSVTGKTLVDHTRQSSATYVDGDGVIRTAVTNLLLQSEDFSTTWNQSGVTVTTNSVAAPTGATTADKLIESSGGTTHLITQTITVANATVYTLSVFAKAAERSRVALYFGGAGGAAQGIIVNLATGAFAANIVAAPTSYSIVPFPNGWYRISITATSSGTAANHSIYICDNTNAFSYSGDGTSGLYLWGAQLEQSSTVGQYVKTTTAKNGAPRFDHDPTTGESLGLLVEESRQNLLTYSEEFDNAAWSKQAGASVDSDAITAPNGTITADRIYNDGTQTGYVERSLSVVSGTYYSYSVFLKKSTSSSVVMLFSGSLFNSGGASCSATFNLDTGIVTTSNGGTGSMTPFADGWYKCSYTKDATATGSAVAQLIRLPGNTSDVYAWGAQLEAGSFPTSYIPTEGSTVTRAADVASITGTNFSSWYEQSEGTMFATSSHFRKFDGSNRFPRIFAVRNTAGSSADEIALGYAVTSGSATTFVPTIRVGAAVQATYSLSGTSNSTSSTIAYKVNNVNAAAGGALGSVDASASIPTVSLALIGDTAGANENINGHISRITFWPTRLSNDTLQTITA